MLPHRGPRFSTEVGEKYEAALFDMRAAPCPWTVSIGGQDAI